MKRFNNGVGCITCDNCKRIIAIGRVPNLKYCYSTKPEDHVLKESHDFCSKDCEKRFKNDKAD